MALAVAPGVTEYVTPYFLGPLTRTLEHAPLVGRELSRRALPATLAECAVTKQTLNEFTRVGLRHLGVRRFDYELLWAKNVRFDRAVSCLVEPDHSAVISQCGAALSSFQTARRLGVRTILDYPIARHEIGRMLVEQEAEAHPDFADTASGRSTLTPRDRELERLGLELAETDCVVVGSQFAAASFEGVVPSDRLAVIPYGVDTSVFNPRPSRIERTRSLNVLFAGQLTVRKGLPYVLEAVSFLDPQRVDLTLVGAMVGSGRWMNAREGEFRYIGVRRPNEMPSVYQQADVLVLPSLAEGSAIVVYEAMASGLPVVVTPNVGADLVRDGIDGFVVPVRSSLAIADCLQRFLDDPELGQKMGMAARSRVLSYDWSAFRQNFRQLLGEDESGDA
jgi:glycosyltransferase involved in cell wall biosynthesis